MSNKWKEAAEAWYSETDCDLHPETCFILGCEHAERVMIEKVTEVVAKLEEGKINPECKFSHDKYCYALRLFDNLLEQLEKGGE